MSAPVIVFLIHGTFAREAGWTKADSPLCQVVEAAARAAKRDVMFRSVEWSGRNTSKARLDGARKLDSHFREACETFPAAPIFMIGHSHGGSVVAYFCRDLPDRLRDRLTGAAFLSTPFIAARIRPDWRQLIAGLGVAIAILVFTALVAFSSYLDFHYQWSYVEIPIPPSVVALLASLCFASFVVAELARRAAIGWGNWISKKVDAAIRIHETARLPAGRNIFLRATGDEAAAALAIGQFAIWLLGKLEMLASRGIGQAWGHILRSRWLSAAAVVFHDTLRHMGRHPGSYHDGRGVSVAQPLCEAIRTNPRNVLNRRDIDSGTRLAICPASTFDPGFRCAASGGDSSVLGRASSGWMGRPQRWTVCRNCYRTGAARRGRVESPRLECRRTPVLPAAWLLLFQSRSLAPDRCLDF